MFHLASKPVIGNMLDLIECRFLRRNTYFCNRNENNAYEKVYFSRLGDARVDPFDGKNDEKVYFSVNRCVGCN